MMTLADELAAAWLNSDHKPTLPDGCPATIEFDGESIDVRRLILAIEYLDALASEIEP